MITRLKVCCIVGREEASLAIRYGAAALGLVPSGFSFEASRITLLAPLSVDSPPT